MRWNIAQHSLALIFIGLLASDSVLANADSPSESRLQNGVYLSPSGKIRCDLDDYASSTGFFINDVYDPGESETLSFGIDADTHFEIWTVRRQREGRLEYLPAATEGFPVSGKTFIPYFYSELPYELESMAELAIQAGQGEVLRVRMDDRVQLHAYWLVRQQGWLHSIQFLPTLIDSTQQYLDEEAAREALSEVLSKCTFK